MHSHDVSRAVETILTKGTIGEIYNISGSKQCEYSVLQIATLLVSFLYPNDSVRNWIEFVADRPFNDTRYFMDGSKLKSLGWNQTIEVKQGIELLIGRPSS